MSREDDLRGGKALLSALDDADQRAEQERARREGEVRRRDLSNVREMRPPQPPAAPPRDEQVRALWRWAAWARPGGIPAGWSEEERPR